MEGLVDGVTHDLFHHVSPSPRMESKANYNLTTNIWLVVWTPLKNISQLGWLFPIYGKIKNVPNHQPDMQTGLFTIAWLVVGQTDVWDNDMAGNRHAESKTYLEQNSLKLVSRYGEKALEWQTTHP